MAPSHRAILDLSQSFGSMDGMDNGPLEGHLVADVRTGAAFRSWGGDLDFSRKKGAAGEHANLCNLSNPMPTHPPPPQTSRKSTELGFQQWRKLWGELALVPGLGTIIEYSDHRSRIRCSKIRLEYRNPARHLFLNKTGFK